MNRVRYDDDDDFDFGGGGASGAGGAGGAAAAARAAAFAKKKKKSLDEKLHDIKERAAIIMSRKRPTAKVMTFADSSDIVSDYSRPAKRPRVSPKGRARPAAAAASASASAGSGASASQLRFARQLAIDREAGLRAEHSMKLMHSMPTDIQEETGRSAANAIVSTIYRYGPKYIRLLYHPTDLVDDSKDSGGGGGGAVSSGAASAGASVGMTEFEKYLTIALENKGRRDNRLIGALQLAALQLPETFIAQVPLRFGGTMNLPQIVDWLKF